MLGQVYSEDTWADGGHKFQRELTGSSCEKSRCVDLAQSPVFWRTFVLAGMIFWGLMIQILILSNIIYIYGKLKTVIAKMHVNANHISNTTICSLT
jgi:hypothetical protein